MTDSVVSPFRMVIPSRQRPKWAPHMARALGTGEDRGAHPPGCFQRKTLTSGPVWRTAQAAAQDSLGVGEAQVRPSQLLFVFLLLGSFPKQTNQGGKMKGTWKRGKCRARWLDPEDLPAPLQRTPAGAPVSAGDPLWAKTQTGGSPQTRASENGNTPHPASRNSKGLTLSVRPHTPGLAGGLGSPDPSWHPLLRG